MADGSIDSPGAQLLASCPSETRLDLGREELALAEAAFFHGADDGVDVIRAFSTRKVAKAVCLHAEPHAGDFRIAEITKAPAEKRECRAAERLLSLELLPPAAELLLGGRRLDGFGPHVAPEFVNGAANQQNHDERQRAGDAEHNPEPGPFRCGHQNTSAGLKACTHWQT